MCRLLLVYCHLGAGAISGSKGEINSRCLQLPPSITGWEVLSFFWWFVNIKWIVTGDTGSHDAPVNPEINTVNSQVKCTLEGLEHVVFSDLNVMFNVHVSFLNICPCLMLQMELLWCKTWSDNKVWMYRVKGKDCDRREEIGEIGIPRLIYCMGKRVLSERGYTVLRSDHQKM